MERPDRHSWLRSFTTTFAAIYLAVTLAGTLSHLLLPDVVGRATALLLAMLLIFIYAVATGPGRRSDWPIYLFAGFLCPPALMALAALAFYLPLSYDAFTVAETLLAGFGVGVTVTGSADPARSATHLAVTSSLWWLGITAAALIPVMIRAVLRKYRAE